VLRREFPSHDEPAPPVPESIGPYRILRKLGQGGMGTVFEAQQENPRRVVAVKVIRPGLVSAAIASRFRHEGQVLGRLRHPGIAQIYEAGTHHTPHGPQAYLLMELVHGQPLLEYAESNRMDVPHRLELLARICDAVQHAHQRGVIHRDLKPDNILVEGPGDAQPQPKILDFGVARVVDPDGQTTTLHTNVGQIVGTIAYMSPEQVGGNPNELDTRSDVYALGVIAYQLLCGRLPYKLNAASVVQSAQVIAHNEPTPLATVVRSLQGDVTTIVGKALEKDKSRRYQSAAEMAADIRRHLRDEPISAHPPSTIYQLRKFARRNKGLVAGVVATIVVLVLGVVGTSIGMIRAQRARVAAEASAEDARRQTQKATAVNDFLVEMLGSASPTELTKTDRAKGPKITMMEVLDAASRKIDAGSLKEQPAIEAAVRRALGQSYVALGAYPAAEAHLRTALSLDRAHYGDGHPEVAAGQRNLASALHRAGKLDEAESLYRASLEVLRARYGDESRQVADCTIFLGALARDRGNFKEAETLFNRALAVHCKLFGEEHQTVAGDMTLLAVTLDHAGRPAEAEALHRRALAMRVRLFGDEHPFVAASLDALSAVLYKERKLDEAESLSRRAARLQETLFGPDHPELAQTLNNLAAILHERGNDDEAAAMLRRTIEIGRKAVGEEHEDVTVAMSNLGMLLLQQGKRDEAEALLRRAVEIDRKVRGPEYPRFASSLNNLAGILRDQGKLDESEALFREAIEIRRKRLGDDHPDVAISIFNFAALLRDRGRNAEAEPYLREAAATIERALGPNHPTTATLRAGWAACLSELGRSEEAEPILVASLQIVRHAYGDTDKRTLGIVKRLITVYESQGKLDQALALRPLVAATNPSTAPASAPATAPAVARSGS
jgi:tetratricopeptide (TPR) repeat protein